MMRTGRSIWAFTEELQRMGIENCSQVIWRVGLIGMLLITLTDLISYAQSSSPVYPRGAIILYRNRVAPFRYARMGGANLFRANINFEGEPIELALIVKGSDGRYYSNAYRRFRLQDGWIIAVATGIHYYDLMGLENIIADNWFRPRTQVDLDIEWYVVDRTEVDRETTKTPRHSPYPPGYRDSQGRSFIRYYLAHISRFHSGWNPTLTPSEGGIIVPIVCIRWEERKDNQRFVRFLWLPGNRLAPMPGMNDCLGLRMNGSGTCQGSRSEPLRGANYNQHYGGRYVNDWAYTEAYRHAIYWYPGSPYIGYPVQYPIFIFQNIGALSQRHSMQGIEGIPARTFIAYDSPRWWVVHRATLYKNAPYEWGGKYYAAEASGDRCSYAPNGTNQGFGLDCSGLIAVALGYPNSTRYGTGAIMMETEPIQRYNRNTRQWEDDWDNVTPGDVVIRHQERGANNHVLLVIQVRPILAPGRVAYRYLCIEAIGADSNEPAANLGNVERVRYISKSASEFSTDPNGAFAPRRFRQLGQ